MVEQRAGANRSTSPLREQFSRGLRFDERFYRVAIANGGNLVGRETRTVTVRPTDGYRYGYRLWLDYATAMPLKVQIVGDDGNVVEQLLFSDIRLPDRIPESAVQPSVMIDSFTWRRSQPLAEKSDDSPAGFGAAGWSVEELPPGFGLLAVRTQRPESGDAPLDHLVYSDGVASVSVFIEAGVAPAERGRGASRMGAANAYTTTIDGYLVTAVGEVPVRTVEAIGRSVRPGAAPER
jgi:sigma-E factor negative regulatory protein RseB